MTDPHPDKICRLITTTPGGEYPLAWGWISTAIRAGESIEALREQVEAIESAMHEREGGATPPPR